jgi:hypothetical protein
VHFIIKTHIFLQARESWRGWQGRCAPHRKVARVMGMRVPDIPGRKTGEKKSTAGKKIFYSK